VQTYVYLWLNRNPLFPLRLIYPTKLLFVSVSTFLLDLLIQLASWFLFGAFEAYLQRHVYYIHTLPPVSLLPRVLPQQYNLSISVLLWVIY